MSLIRLVMDKTWVNIINKLKNAIDRGVIYMIWDTIITTISMTRVNENFTHEVNIIDKSWSKVIDKSWNKVIDKSWNNVIDKSWNNAIDESWNNVMDKSWNNVIDESWNNIDKMGQHHQIY